MSSIFISYAHENKEFAKNLAKELRAFGHTVWIDETELLIGDSLTEKLCDIIDNVDFVGAIISSASINSPWVKKELELASNREIDEGRVIVLPILLDDIKLPGFLKGKVYADFKLKKNYKEGIKKLLDRLGAKTEPPDLSNNKMVIKPYLFIETSRHGYLRVPRLELDQLGIRKKITEFSYQDNLYAYLEEDCDLTIFIEAKEKIHGGEYDLEKDLFEIYVEEFPFEAELSEQINNSAIRKQKKQIKSNLCN